MSIDRRAVLGATAALLALPAAGMATSTPRAAVAAPAAASPVAALWDEVVDLSMRLGNHATPIVHPKSGLPGWMYDTGEANALGHARYGKLMQILHATPQSSADLGIIARASTHPDIANGPATYGAARFAHAAMTLAA